MKFIITIHFVFSLLLCTAQQNVTGIVRDAETQEPIPFVKVMVQNSTIMSLTNFNGEYDIKVTSFPVTLEFSTLNYETKLVLLEFLDISKTSPTLASESATLDQVEVIAGKNPAFKVLDSIKKHKKENNANNLKEIEYQQYNKFQFGINNLADDFKDRKFLADFNFITDYVDTASDKNVLPILLTETVSNVYIKNNPKQRKEIILGTHVTGIDNLNLNQFTQDISKEINLYSNQLAMFGRDFTSPISPTGRLYYKYYKLDNDTINGEICIHLSFKPKRTGDPVFKGDIWVGTSDFGLRKVDMVIPNNVNLNFVSNFKLKQTYTNINSSQWLMTNSIIESDFTLKNESNKKNKKTIQVLKTGVKTNVKLETEHESEFYIGNVIAKEDALEQTNEFWNEIRPIELSTQEAGVIEMIDSLKSNKKFKLYDNITKIAMSGYKEINKIEIGYLYSLYNRNDIEGASFMLRLRTSKKFSKSNQISTFAKYGLKDKEFKFGIAYDKTLKTQLEQKIHFSYSYDLKQLARKVGVGSSNNPFANLFSNKIQNKLTMVEEFNFSYSKQYLRPIRTVSSLSLKNLNPVGITQFKGIGENGEIQALEDLTTFEIINQITFSKNERFIKINGKKLSLGSTIPVISLTHTLGLKNVLGSRYNYNKFDINMSHRPKIGRLGKLRYTLYAGKVIGKVPYPFMNTHPTNESFYLEINSFNLLNYYELISDTWVGVNFQHQLQGLILDRIPLVKKLKWRTLYGFKAVVGSYKANSNFELPDYSRSLTFAKPYMEANIGIENIFKILRVDAVWRLSHLDSPNISKFGVRFRFVGNF